MTVGGVLLSVARESSVANHGSTTEVHGNQPQELLHRARRGSFLLRGLQRVAVRPTAAAVLVVVESARLRIVPTHLTAVFTHVQPRLDVFTRGYSLRLCGTWP